MNRFQQRRTISWLSVLFVAGSLVISEFHSALASDHLDTPTVIADPAADIGDIFLLHHVGEPLLRTCDSCFNVHGCLRLIFNEPLCKPNWALVNSLLLLSGCP